MKEKGGPPVELWRRLYNEINHHRPNSKRRSSAKCKQRERRRVRRVSKQNLAVEE